MRYSYSKKEAKETFDSLQAGILRLIKAADIYAVHVIANYQQTPLNEKLVQAILLQNKTSGFRFRSGSYNDEILQKLETNQDLSSIGEQIILSTYTAFELYLIEKFREYYRHILRKQHPKFIEKSLKRISLRSIQEIKTNYIELLQIYLPSFELQDFKVDSESSFQPKNSWEAILLVANARNDIAHKGYSPNYKVITLVDSWAPFDFIRRKYGCVIMLTNLRSLVSIVGECAHDNGLMI